MKQLRIGVAVMVAAFAMTTAGSGRPSAGPAGALAAAAPAQVDRGGAAAASWSDEGFRGFVMPSRQVELAAPIEEILWSVAVEESDRVEAGQVLAKMDDRLQQVVVEAARVRAESTADLERAKLDIEDANLTLERITAAFERSAANELEVRRAQIALGRANAAHAAAIDNKALAEVNLRLEEERLERYLIRAPFDGTVIDVIAELGAMLTDTDDVLMLADIDTLEAQLNLPIELFGSLKVGERYVLVANDPVNDELAWRLKTINPIIDTASRTFRCVFSLDNPGAVLPAGFTVRLKWPQGE
ncbi:MAG: efflux RND transporter periplasmic adaptor subunit [Planctomycetota bacterium]|jgi:RND family efflux transporter MFP subunit